MQHNINADLSSDGLTHCEDSEAMFGTQCDYYCDGCADAFGLRQLDAGGARHTMVRRLVRNRFVCVCKSMCVSRPKPLSSIEWLPKSWQLTSIEAPASRSRTVRALHSSNCDAMPCNRPEPSVRSIRVHYYSDRPILHQVSVAIQPT